MSQGNNNNNNGGNSDGSGGNKTAGVGIGSKIGYIGTGVVIGLIVYPFVRKAIASAQPKLDKMLDEFTGKAENVAEKASDMFARAKSRFNEDKKEDGHNHSHDGHSHPEDKA